MIIIIIIIANSNQDYGKWERKSIMEMRSNY